MTKLGVELHLTRDADKNERIDRVLRPEGDLTTDQVARLADIAERTPVTLTLKRGLPIITRLE
jgi:putative redox protein